MCQAQGIQSITNRACFGGLGVMADIVVPTWRPPLSRCRSADRDGALALNSASTDGHGVMLAVQACFAGTMKMMSYETALRWSSGSASMMRIFLFVAAMKSNRAARHGERYMAYLKAACRSRGN